MYKTETYTAVVPVEDYIEGYVDVDTFLECCRACPNYEKVWSCPSYDFDVLSYWRKYETLELTAVKIIFDEEFAGKAFTKAEQDKILGQSLRVEKEKLSEMLWEKENNIREVSACQQAPVFCAKETVPDRIKKRVDFRKRCVIP